MNNRIRELAGRAGFTVPTAGWTAKDFDIRVESVSVETELEAFVSLLIEDISANVKSFTMSNTDSIRAQSYNQGIDHAVRFIKLTYGANNE